VHYVDLMCLGLGAALQEFGFRGGLGLHLSGHGCAVPAAPVCGGERVIVLAWCVLGLGAAV
jgi:hypothetical protein